VPIAILPEVVQALARTGQVLTPWNQLVELEEQLLRRARSAFIVRWFGTSVPEDRFSLAIAIVNIEALKARYHQAKESVVAGPSGPNLFGPLAGLAGLLVGMVTSVPGIVMVADQLGHHLAGGDLKGDLLAMLIGAIGVGIVPPLVLLIAAAGAPVAAYGGLAAAIGHEPTRAILLLLGEAAALFAAANVLWSQLKGPRSEVRNPLLAKILAFADSLSKGYAHTLGFVALVVTKIGALLPGLIAQLRALGTLLGSVLAVLAEATTGVRDTLMAPFEAGGGLVPTLKKLFKRIGKLPGVAVGLIEKLFDTVVLNLVAGRNQVVVTITAWVAEVEVGLGKIFAQTAIGRLVERTQELRKLLPDIVHAFQNPPKPPPEKKEESSSFWWGVGYVATLGLLGNIDDLVESGKKIKLPGLPDTTLPKVPDLPKLPDIDALSKKLDQPASLDAREVGRQAQASADALRAKLGVPAEIRKRPRSAFADQRAALEKEGSPFIRDVPWLLGDKELRDLIYLAVGRVLPSALRPLAADVKATFDKVDQDVYGVEPTELGTPMLDLEDNGRLRPVVRKLVVRSDGLAPDVRGFRDVLVEELEARTYLAPAG
jgi:hypothetical protein